MKKLIKDLISKHPWMKDAKLGLFLLSIGIFIFAISFKLFSYGFKFIDWGFLLLFTGACLGLFGIVILGCSLFY